MTDHLDLRAALQGLAAADAPGPVATGAVVGAARRMRRRRRAGAAFGCAVAGVAFVAGVARPAPRTHGLVVAPNPVQTPASESASPVPSSAAPDGGAPSSSPDSPPDSPYGSPSASASASASPSGAPVDVVVTLPPAGPRPKPVCNLVVDAAGDEGTTPAEPTLDVVSADLATGTQTLVVVVRTRGTTYPAAGATWTFAWSLGGESYVLTATRDATGATAGSLTRDGGPATATSVMLSAGAVTWKVPRADVPALASATTFSGLRATTSRGTGATATAADVATSKATYEDRTPSCLKAG